ncbi:MAG: acyl carrier protein [Chitinispirillia bacterium]|nr:acyl carrier protein [Chitinispirillia bacterium]MCL2269043.1 acyl carrier protein [Chitinispirillia bacterium]
MSDIEARVKKVIVDKIHVAEDKITPDAKFVEDLGADSLDLVELIMGLEEEFELDDIPDTESDKIRTVKAAMDYIASKL